MAEDVYPVLLEYDWPGNVRELKNLMQEMAITCPDKVLNASHVSLTKNYISDVATPEGASFEFDFDRASNYHEIMRELEGPQTRCVLLCKRKKKSFWLL